MKKCIHHVLRRIDLSVMITLIALAPRFAFAINDAGVLRPIESIVTFISGPLATALVSLGLAGALISLVFMGGQYIGRLLTAFFSGIGLFMLDRLVNFVSSAAR